MNAERYNTLKVLIEAGRWEIDVTRGEVKGRRGSKGHTDSFGYKRLTARRGKKEYHFAAHEIVAIKQGIDLTGKEVSFLDGDRQNAAFHNLTIGLPGDAARTALMKRGKTLNKHLKKEVVSQIKRDLLDGLSRKEIAQKHDTKERSVARIDKGLAFKIVEPVVMQ